MSDKINQLIEQATDEVPHERDWDSFQRVFNKEKFARLFLKECELYINNEVARLEKYSLEVMDDAQYTRDVDICIEKCLDNLEGLKQHFGVK